MVNNWHISMLNVILYGGKALMWFKKLLACLSFPYFRATRLCLMLRPRSGEQQSGFTRRLCIVAERTSGLNLRILFGNLCQRLVAHNKARHFR